MGITGDEVNVTSMDETKTKAGETGKGAPPIGGMMNMLNHAIDVTNMRGTLTAKEKAK